MSNHEIETKAAELMEIRNQIEELEAMKAALEDILKMAMADAGTETMNAGQYKLAWKVITSNRFDSSAFKKENPELAAQYTKETRACRFTISA